jgi:hypothetical protein
MELSTTCGTQHPNITALVDLAPPLPCMRKEGRGDIIEEDSKSKCPYRHSFL